VHTPTRHDMSLQPLLVLLACLAALPLCAQQATPDQQAHFLAGRPVDGTPLESLAREPAWGRHAAEFNKAWDGIEQRQLEKIGSWVPRALGSASTSREPLFYMFSGPDFLYAYSFFPDASTYVFCGLEPPGTVPDVAQLPPGTLDSALANLRRSLNSVLSFSFFITKDMKNDLGTTRLTGSIPPLLVFLARLGLHIESIKLVGLNDDGSLAGKDAPISGVQITFAKAGEATQTLYYFSTDLSDSGIAKKPGFLRFCDGLGPGNGFVKAASYLMHRSHFSKVRGFLLTHAMTIVEDDSGIPIRCFAPDQWDLSCAGRYPGPIKLFEQYYQADLGALFRRGNPNPIDFSFGYRWHPDESSVIVAKVIQVAPRAIPVVQ